MCPSRSNKQTIARAIDALLTGLYSLLLAYEAAGSVAAGDGLCWPRG
jgi:hypothetical protein